MEGAEVFASCTFAVEKWGQMQYIVGIEFLETIPKILKQKKGRPFFTSPFGEMIRFWLFRRYAESIYLQIS